MSIEARFARLGTDQAPGQEGRRDAAGLASRLTGGPLAGRAVDFSHGDVDAHPPAPGAFEAFTESIARGGARAYTEYRGDPAIRERVAARLAEFTGAPVDPGDGLILTPGTQGALFLAVAATVARGDAIAIVQPDYFANRKLAEFLEAEIVPVRLTYAGSTPGEAGLDLGQLEEAFRAGARAFLFSNPNNPTGVVYPPGEIARISALAARYGVTVIVDQLYSRLCYEGVRYTHLRAAEIDPEQVVTIMGPSKTESLSGYRLGAAFGSKRIVDRMEKLQAIVSLRAAGYAQGVLATWFNEPAGWMAARIARHRAIRDDLVAAFAAIDGCSVRAPEAGSYLFPRLPPMRLAPAEFIGALRAQARVTVTPGTEFSPHAETSIRLNFSQDHAAAVAAVERLSSLVERYRA